MSGGVDYATGSEIRALDNNEGTALCYVSNDVERANLHGCHKLVHAERCAA